MDFQKENQRLRAEIVALTKKLDQIPTCDVCEKPLVSSCEICNKFFCDESDCGGSCDDCGAIACCDCLKSCLECGFHMCPDCSKSNQRPCVTCGLHNQHQS